MADIKREHGDTIEDGGLFGEKPYLASMLEHELSEIRHELRRVTDEASNVSLKLLELQNQLRGFESYMGHEINTSRKSAKGGIETLLIIIAVLLGYGIFFR